MKEQIYTIPVMDAFNTDCECALCVLEEDIEYKEVEYTLGPSMMEPDSRVRTNKKGFCRKHFKLLYDENDRLALALIIDTHLAESNSKLLANYSKKMEILKKDSSKSAVKTLMDKLKRTTSEADNIVESMLSYLKSLEDSCVICEKAKYTMERYIDVIFYLWVKEEQFKEIFNKSKGFCLYHLRMILEGAKKHLNDKNLNLFLADLIPMEMDNLERIQKEVNWFTKKFDYRNSDAPWGNSRDAVSRSIEKIAGYSYLKKDQ